MKTIYLLSIIFWPVEPPHSVMIVDTFATKKACYDVRDSITLRPYGKAICTKRTLDK